ncbi:MAG: hypothetical protein ACI9EF_003640 [Pseudohongiellaceae bacterium]|jgi:hypothetical protein
MNVVLVNRSRSVAELGSIVTGRHPNWRDVSRGLQSLAIQWSASKLTNEDPLVG